VLREVDSIVFLEDLPMATAVIPRSSVLFSESSAGPVSPGRRSAGVGTSLRIISTLEIDKADFDVELARLQRLGVEVTTAPSTDGGQWRSLYVRDPEGNNLELVGL
jgi:catechol 2,3-dioxygenase-like lactoylglutathione lyase family enzyme